MHTDESTAIRTHIPCPHCSSHDALTEYTDGHTYCYSCETYTNPTKPNKKTKKEDTQKMSGKLLTFIYLKNLLMEIVVFYSQCLLKRITVMFGNEVW